MLSSILIVAQVLLSLFLIGAVLLQQRGAGLGATFGGDGNSYRTKRGIEKKLFHATIIVSILFFATSLAGHLI